MSLNPADFYRDAGTDWREFWDTTNSPINNVSHLIKKFVVLPDERLVKIAATYCYMSSKWTRIAGVLFSCGDSGSGKSTIAKLAGILHGYSNTLSSSDTFPSIRNELASRKFGRYDREQKEWAVINEIDGCLLCWDNIDRHALERDPRTYSLLLLGYDRQTSLMSIAQPDGSNISFDVYCPKIISSIDPFHLAPEYSELRRRAFLLPHKKLDKMLPSEGYDSDFLDVNNIDWTEINDLFFQFWAYEQHCRDFVTWRQLLTKPGTRPKEISPERWTISVDLLATGLVGGGWVNIKDAIDNISWYWAYVQSFSQFEGAATKALLQEFIDMSCQVQDNPGKEVINPKVLKTYVDSCDKEGKLDIQMKRTDLIRYMSELGWFLSPKGWIRK